jgi:hypothetical protein
LVAQQRQQIQIINAQAAAQVQVIQQEAQNNMTLLAASVAA